MTSGINGPCNRDCPLGRPHHLECHNYIETELPCPICGGEHGRHLDACPMTRTALADPRDTP